MPAVVAVLFPEIPPRRTLTPLPLPVPIFTVPERLALEPVMMKPLAMLLKSVISRKVRVVAAPDSEENEPLSFR